MQHVQGLYNMSLLEHRHRVYNEWRSLILYRHFINALRGLLRTFIVC